MLTVYVAGLIYFNGCKQPVKRMYAPDGTDGEPPHYASLWLAPELVEENGTQWWNGFRHTRNLEGVPMVEFRIPAPAEIAFPDLGNDPGPCDDLEDKLPKLKKKKDDGSEEPYVVDPAAAKTIAEVTIRGGSLTPRRFTSMGLVVWSIPTPSALQITATLQNDSSESGTIALKSSAAVREVVFANSHELSVTDKKKDGPDDDDDHDLALFKQLNPALADAILVSKKAPGSAGQLKVDHSVLERLSKIKYSGGDPPNCCD